MAFPEVVSREQWLEARLRLLAEEKEETRRRDALNAGRRRLPMVRIEKEYLFEGPQGPVTLAGLGAKIIGWGSGGADVVWSVIVG